MIRFAVMGNPVLHSLSPIIHQEFAQQFGIKLCYEKILGETCGFEAQVMAFFSNGGRGLNITLPFKERAFAMSLVRTPRCLVAKAINTLWMEADTLHGDNTDGVGLIRDLSHYINLSEKNILLLGAGGAARGVLAPLLATAASVTIINRTKERAFALLTDFPTASIGTFDDLDQRSFDVVINATSASLNNQTLRLPTSLLQKKPFCYDLTYSKAPPTPFVSWARSLGCEAMDGLGMLVEQAAESFCIWHGVMPDTKTVLNI
jgi:shikimate dehydrogenase